MFVALLEHHVEVYLTLHPEMRVLVILLAMVVVAYLSVLYVLEYHAQRNNP